MEQSEEITKSRIPRWLKTGVPIIVSAAILYYYFRGQDWGVLIDALAGAYVPMAIIGMVGPQVIIWYSIALGTHLTLEWFHGPVSLRDIFFAKGATYLLSLINNPLAGGGYFLYQVRKADISVRKLGGITLLRVGLGMWGFNVYMVLATGATQYYGLGIEDHINMYVWWGFIIFGFLWMVEAWFFWHHGKNIGLSRILVRKEDEFWSGWVQANRRHWLIIWAISVPPFILLFLGYYVVALSFGIEVPFWKFMAMIPLVLGISNLPVAMGGFGTTTLAWVTFFPEYGADEQLLAISLFIPTARVLTRSIIGVICLPPVIKDLTNMPPKMDIR